MEPWLFFLRGFFFFFWKSKFQICILRVHHPYNSILFDNINTRNSFSLLSFLCFFFSFRGEWIRLIFLWFIYQWYYKSIIIYIYNIIYIVVSKYLIWDDILYTTSIVLYNNHSEQIFTHTKLFEYASIVSLLKHPLYLLFSFSSFYFFKIFFICRSSFYFYYIFIIGKRREEQRKRSVLCFLYNFKTLKESTLFCM